MELVRPTGLNMICTDPLGERWKEKPVHVWCARQDLNL